MTPSQREIAGCLERLNGSGSDDEWAAIQNLRAVADLPKLLLQQYRLSTRYGQRASCVYHSLRYALTSKDAVALGIAATADRSKVVRYRAAMLLAISQDASAIPALRTMEKAFPNTAEDATAAIRAIESRNQNLFVDRKNTGKVMLRLAEHDG